MAPKGVRRSIGGRGSTGGALPKGLLPPGNAAAASWGPGRKLPYSQTPESQGRMLVLAADDGPMNAAVISMLLETDPRFQLLVVGSGAEVLQYVAQAEHLPDIILLDVLLPDATGPEVRRSTVMRHGMQHQACLWQWCRVCSGQQQRARMLLLCDFVHAVLGSARR